MGKTYRFFRLSAFGLALACAVLASKPAYAQTLITFGCGDVTLTEGTSGDILCALVNNSSGNITISSTNPFSEDRGLFVGGDMTDVATFAGFSTSGLTEPCTAGETLLPLQGCEFDVAFTTDNPAGETDNNFGEELWTIEVNPTLGTSTPLVEVVDPGPTPELPSVFLFGSGLLGMVGFLRRKLL